MFLRGADIVNSGTSGDHLITIFNCSLNSLALNFCANVKQCREIILLYIFYSVFEFLF